MRTKLLHESDGLRTFAVVLDTGEEVLASLKEVATREGGVVAWTCQAFDFAWFLQTLSFR